MSYNVLIVDDSKIARAGVRKSISMANLPLGEVYEACNGIAALKVLQEKWVDIVFSDLTMPEMDGFELIEKMAVDNLLLKIPVVIVSSQQSIRLKDDLQARGVFGYVRKPFRPENFQEVVEQLLGRGKSA